MSATSGILFHVSFMCQACKLIFKSVEMYCSHKLEFHFTQLKKISCIVFTESIVEPTDAASLNFGTSVVVPPIKEFVTDELTDKIAVHVDVKQEPHEEANPIAINNTVGVSIPLENEYFNNNHYFDDTQSSLISPSVDVDLSDKHVEDVCNDHDPLEDFEDGTQFETESASTRITETKMEYFNENSSESDDDIICLDDPLSPTSSSKFLTSTTRTAARLNDSVSSEFKLECQICSKKFTSSAQLGIHFAICQLYNSGKTRKTPTKPIIPKPGSVSGLKIRVRAKRKRAKSLKDVWVKCGVCSQLIRRCRFRWHLKDHQVLAPAPGEALSGSGFVCQICGSAFRRKDNFEVHAVVHSKETPFKCSFSNCNAAFRYKSSIYRHLKTHTRSN